MSSNRKLHCGGGVQGCKVSRDQRRGVGHLFVGGVNPMSDTPQ